MHNFMAQNMHAFQVHALMHEKRLYKAGETCCREIAQGQTWSQGV